MARNSFSGNPLRRKFVPGPGDPRPHFSETERPEGRINPVRPIGLLLGSGVLILGSLIALVLDGGLQTIQAAPRASVEPAPAGAVTAVMPPAEAEAQPVLVYAETPEGEPLLDALRKAGIDPSAVGLVVHESRLVAVPPADARRGTAGLLQPGGPDAPACLGELRIPPGGAWVHLVWGEVILARRVLRGDEGAVRFVIAPQELARTASRRPVGPAPLVG